MFILAADTISPGVHVAGVLLTLTRASMVQGPVGRVEFER